MEDEIERSFQMLESLGVSRDKAGTVSNGIDVLATRYHKEIAGLRHDISKYTLGERNQEIKERI